MSRFEPNEKAIKQIGKDIAKAAADAGNEVAKSHSGKPEKEIRAALQAAMANGATRGSSPPVTCCVGSRAASLGGSDKVHERDDDAGTAGATTGPSASSSP